MPIPKPGDKEEQKDFLSRCMGDEVMNREYPDQTQRAAVCNTSWRDKDKKTAAEEWLAGVTFSEGGSVPKEEIMVFPLGKFKHPQYGNLNFDEGFFEEIIANYDGNVLQTTPFLDQEHRMGEALAWFNTAPYIKPGVGLFIKPSYTEMGTQLLEKKIYKYFSPWYEDFPDPKTGKITKNVFRGGAVTNIPYLKMMPPIVDESTKASERKAVGVVLAEFIPCGESDGASGSGQGGPTSGKAGADKQYKKMEVHKMDELKKLLGLAPETTDADVMAVVKAMAEAKAAKEVEDKKKLDEEKAKAAEAAKKLAEGQGEVKKLSDIVADLSKKLVERDCESVIGKAMAEGKILPKDKELWVKKFLADPASIGEIVAVLPVAVPTGELGKGGAGLEGNPAEKLVTLAEKISVEKKIDYNSAFTLAQEQNPALTEEYLKWARKPKEE